MFPGSAGGALPWAVIGHRAFDAKVTAVKVGDDQEKRRGRIRGEIGLHAPSPTTIIEPDKDSMRQRSGPVVATVHPSSITTHGESRCLVEIALPPPLRPT